MIGDAGAPDSQARRETQPRRQPGNRRARAVCGAALLAAALPVASAGAADEYQRFHWYRIELVIFERQLDEPPDDTGEQLLNTRPHPRLAVPLTAGEVATGEPLFAPPPVVDDLLPLVISNLPPPIWFAGDCAAEYWEPPDQPYDASGNIPRDPCLSQNPPAVQDPAPPETADLPLEADYAAWNRHRTPGARTRLLATLRRAFETHERRLFETSYIWQPKPPRLTAEVNKLRQRFNTLAAGTWHQPLPARDRPQPLLLQIGTPDPRDQRFPLEGWLSVTRGRYVHVDVHLYYRRPSVVAEHFPQTAPTVLFSERRRMRVGELHYLDHPALGMLARVEPVPVPRRLLELINAVEELN